jgi:hypothetical protein
MRNLGGLLKELGIDMRSLGTGDTGGALADRRAGDPPV